jgi:hypothetical protein
MADPEMRPDELAWAFQNAGRAPAAQQSSSETFAAQARQAEAKRLEQVARQQHAQDLQWNRAIHAQDMETAEAQQRALRKQYTLLDQTQNDMGSWNMSTADWKSGFAAGLAAGAFFAWLFGGKR